MRPDLLVWIMTAPVFRHWKPFPAKVDIWITIGQSNKFLLTNCLSSLFTST
jgi:hypothetical protein